jgi:hypothetical protein
LKDIDEGVFHMPHGHGVVQHCAWLDVRALLDAQRDRMVKDGSLVEELFRSRNDRYRPVEPPSMRQARSLPTPAWYP